MAVFDVWKHVRCPVVGMIHLPPLPGAPGATLSIDGVTATALADARTLQTGGVDGVLVENFGDAPFYPHRVPAHTIAAMTAVLVEVRRHFSGPLGVNVLRNDACGALSVALASKADFIRVNVLSGTRCTDQGVISGEAHELLRWRRYLDATDVRVFADVNVKHSTALSSVAVGQLAEETVQRAGADALIVSGATTGRPASADELVQVVQAVAGTPVFLGSGVTPSSVAEMAGGVHGVIVGTSLKRDGRIQEPVDVDRVVELIRAVRGPSVPARQAE